MMQDIQCGTDSGRAQVEPSPFALVSDNLARIGAISVERFLSSLSDSLDLPAGLQDYEPSGQTDLTSNPTYNEPKSASTSAANEANKISALARLHQTCQRRFGCTDALKFEYVEEDGASSKRCVLTITRPNGVSRCYATQPVFSRKNEAKSHVASIAISMGAIDFILTGDQGNLNGKKGPLLAPLDAPSRSTVSHALTIDPNDKDASIIEIEECCRQWRAGLVKAHWVPMNDRRNGNKFGAALRIRLSLHSFRVYSTGLIFNNALEAKRTCAKLAMEQGVLDFIKFGNGQTQPAVAPADHEDKVCIEDTDDPLLTSPLSLQDFYEALPRPFPESFGDKTAAEINGAAWLNVTIQSARGGKLAPPTFIWTLNSKNGLYGCLLRIERSGDSAKSYLVDSRFVKRADAKSAVCLQAMSEGVGGYIRSISSTIESKITSAMRKYVTERVYPLLASEYAKIRPGTHPGYEFQRDRDAFGCTMKVILSPAPAIDDVRLYNVPTEYRNKADAKTAVTISAVQQGLVELLRFRGKTPPPDYKPFPTSFEDEALNDEPVSKKRREPEPEEQELQSQPHKKRKTNNHQQRQGDVPSMHNNENSARWNPRAKPNNKQSGFRNGKKHGNDNRSWKKPHVPGPGGFDFPSETADAGRPMDQTRSGPRYESGSKLTSRGRTQARSAHAHPSRPLPGTSAPNPSVQSHNVNLGHGGGPVLPQPLDSSPPELFRGSTYTAQTHKSSHGASHSPAYPIPHYANFDAVSSSVVGGYMQRYGSYPGQSSSAPYSAGTRPAPVYHHSSVPAVKYYPRHSTSAGSHLPKEVSGSKPIALDYGIAHQNASQPEPGSQVDKAPGGASRNIRPGSPSSSNRSHAPAAERLNDKDGDQPPPVPEKMGPVKDGKTSTAEQQHVPADNSKLNPTVSSTLQQMGNKPKTTGAEQSTKSHVAALLDHCEKQGTSRPRFHHEVVPDDLGTGNERHKVWIVMGSERLELPTTFSTMTEGQERVAKQVLNRIRSRAKKGKEKEK